MALPRFLSDNHINPNNASLQGTVVAIYDIGCLVGCILCMFTGQRLGRRIFIVVGGVFLVIGASLQAASNSATFLIAGRVVGGVGMGINTVIVPVWVAETSKSGSRGAQITTQMCLVCIGIVVAFWFDFGMIYHHINSTAVWRAPVAFQIIFIVLSWVTIFFLPESPRYLYANGYIADGDDVMARLYKLAPDSGEVLALRNDVLATLEAAKEHHFRMTDLIYDRSQVNATWRLWMCVLIQLLQQMDGNNIISYYSSYLFIHSLGMSQRHASVTSGGIALLALGGCISAVWTTERFGRRAVMLWGAVALTLFMTLFTIGLGINTDASLKLAVVSIFLFEFSLGASWACVVWVYIPEIAPLNVRHVGAALGTFTSWGVTFIVSISPLALVYATRKCLTLDTDCQTRPCRNHPHWVQVLYHLLRLHGHHDPIRLLLRQRDKGPLAGRDRPPLRKEGLPTYPGGEDPSQKVHRGRRRAGELGKDGVGPL